MNEAILTETAQALIRNHPGTAIDKLALSKSPVPGVGPGELAEQVESRKRCEKKLPEWYHSPGIYYPPKLSVEQASSSVTADYKSRLAQGRSLADLTGGMGVDSYFFSKQGLEVTHCELSESLSAIAAWNAERLGVAHGTFVAGDGVAYLSSTDRTFDTIYVDPSRRAGTSRVFRLKDCLPDVTLHRDLFLQKAGRLIVKTSPLLDITAGLSELGAVEEIHVVSVKNECKELLWILGDSKENDPLVVCAALGGTGDRLFRFRLSEEARSAPPVYSTPLAYLYEPDAALLKAGCFKLPAARYRLEKLARHSHLYTSDSLSDDFMGKTFKVALVQAYKDFTKDPGHRKANVVSRNFPHPPETLKKKHKLVDGGDDFLFFTKTETGHLVVVRAQRIA